MAKKKKKYLIKLNNKIRNYFNGLPFDEGVSALDDDKLIELIMLLELTLPSHEHDDMVRALRRVWSEEGAGTREVIVSYLTKGYKAVHKSNGYEKYPKGISPQTEGKKPLDKVEKILMLLHDVTHTKQEENLVLDAFINVKNSKITEDKILSKLGYLRIKSRLQKLEKALDVQFNSSNGVEGSGERNRKIVLL